MISFPLFEDLSKFCDGERIPGREGGSREIKEEVTAIVQAKASGGRAWIAAPGMVSNGQIWLMSL